MLTKLAMQLAEWPVGTALDWPDYVAEGWLQVRSMLVPSGDETDACITKQNWLAERKRLINKPSWKDAPEWATHLMQASCSYWYWVANPGERFERVGTWGADRSARAGKGAIPAGHDWRQTLERRPDNQPDAKRDCEQRLAGARLSDDLRHVTPADLVNRQLLQRCEELEEANAALVDENLQLRRLMGNYAA
nr:hypothetical protein [uncultured Halomonas sp.]